MLLRHIARTSKYLAARNGTLGQNAFCRIRLTRRYKSDAPLGSNVIGTANSHVAVVEGSRASVIENIGASKTATSAVTLTPEGDCVVGAPTTLVQTVTSAKPQQPVWEVVPVEAAVGAVLPFSQLNFLQMMFFPYTYAAMYYLDFLHNFIPWWQAIILTTATARLMFFPLVLKQNIIGIKSFNILPETQKLQVKMNEAMVSGDAYNQALARTKLQILYKEHGITIKQRLIPILIQAPMYASIFFLLRALTGIPAEGLATGGALWFTDLTIPDPYYILPIMTSTTMFLLLEYGLEGAVSPSQGMAPIGRYLMRALPFGLFFFIQSFPAATLLFWATSNSFTLFYALLMKNQWIKKKFKIPARLVHNPADLPLANMSFKGQVKSAVDKGKVKRTSLDVRRLDDIAFKKAGIGPLRKTYKEPPKDS